MCTMRPLSVCPMYVCGLRHTEHIAGTLSDGEAAVGLVCEGWALSAGLCLLDLAALPDVSKL